MISIIIPTLNEEKIIKKTLTHLRGSHTFPYEIIVSDGKSKDMTIEIANKLADKVVVYSGEKRQTIAMGRNLGASVASGDYYLFIDADMYIPSIDHFLKRAMAHFEHDSNLVGLTVYIKIFPESSTFSDMFFSWFINTMIFSYNNIFHYGASSGEFQMMRAEAFKKVRGYNEVLVAGEDFDMFARLSRIGRTRSDRSLHAFHTGRRVHKIGWPKLLWSWFINWYHATFHEESRISEWEEVR